MDDNSYWPKGSIVKSVNLSRAAINKKWVESLFYIVESTTGTTEASTGYSFKQQLISPQKGIKTSLVFMARLYLVIVVNPIK